MFDPESRYANLGVATHVGADGREVQYVRRRFIRHARGEQPVRFVVVNDGDRLDLLAARALGDPLKFWKICDANEVLQPDETTSTAGREIELPAPF